ncbi:RimK family alpha-L-glutamate ligase [Brachybacterium sp. P6-10-X1]|uniref:ATP-grasp domain-containing protein n=1 Tax=Brachybacterium sp. P6-10-X1 TaxID=1903186 RepID=UPI0020A25FA4|nr:alpha-L-glutamate ligase [Brachybacterium sp. P6-10-X1]
MTASPVSPVSVTPAAHLAPQAPAAPSLREHPVDHAVHVLHDNPEWLPPFRRAFEAEGVPLVEWRLGEGSLDLDAEPPRGVIWSRLSASSHTRGAAPAKDAARSITAWAASWGRRVVNGQHVADLEVSKVLQHAQLRRAGFDVPRTLAVFGRDDLLEAAEGFRAPFLTKHNQGGKGLGVRRVDDHADFAAYVRGERFEDSADGITLLQELLVAEEPAITRAEFVGGEFVYAVRVDTSGGAFELCPAEACAVPGEDEAAEPMFRIRPEVTAQTPLIGRYRALLAELGIEIAGIEYMTTVDGRTVTYDINTNTNYNPDVEESLELPAARRIARYLGTLLREEQEADGA